MKVSPAHGRPKTGPEALGKVRGAGLKVSDSRNGSWNHPEDDQMMWCSGARGPGSRLSSLRFNLELSQQAYRVRPHERSSIRHGFRYVVGPFKAPRPGPRGCRGGEVHLCLVLKLTS